MKRSIGQSQVTVSATTETPRVDSRREIELNSPPVGRPAKGNHVFAGAADAAHASDTIVGLEQTIEEERACHSQELSKQAMIFDQARLEGEARLIEADCRHAALLAAANDRAKEAEELAEVARRRMIDEVAAARAHEDVRVAEIRAQAEARVQECETKMRAELELRNQHIVERQKAMEEALYTTGRQKVEMVDAARMQLSAMEQDFLDIRAKQEAEFSMKEARLDEWKATSKRQAEDLVKHHKGLLELEQSLHSRTIERTMDRVVSHLKMDSQPPAEVSHLIQD
ncbi:unnamed protein product [Polarella glacialis]|uniref:Uncharacterized protein n=1 Tax=Polarella glacialis TaxID=89957 RepID=A0A813ELD3_POLGL|nr:unnamed protein product [Polarella glacialis]